ncbi:hypothetical protein [Methylotenera versatilis]|uniref:hypothetical protein n=1 Tax=Methylotenera versatilis TaxID=1055487 RepID=UPI000648F292|nr:hypothetical protein [Methylotenera versatilis]
MTLNRLLKTFTCLLLSLLISNAALAASTKLPGNIAVHIAKTHYEHPVRLLHPYLNVWHMKGPLAEKAALKSLEKRFENIQLCTNSDNANVVLLLEPHMFYNPQLRVFHGEIIARAFINTAELNDLDKPFITVKKQAQQIGDLGIKPDFYMEKAYIKAMDKIIKKLETDKTFLSTINTAQNGNAKSLCSALDDLPIAKFYY